MPLHQKVFFLVVAAAFLLVVLELVRRRRLRVEYSWLWLGAAVGLIVVILRYELLVWLTEAVGAVVPTSTVFFLATLFLGLLGLHYSVRLTTLTREVKELAQELALMRAAVDESAAARRGTAADQDGGSGKPSPRQA